MGNEPDEQSRRRAQHLGPQRRRPQVLDAALDIALREGLSAVTVASVADRLRVTRPVVYSCFADRRQLLDALCRREEQYFVDALLPALPAHLLGDDEAALTSSMRALLRAGAARPRSWQFLAGPAESLVATRDDRGELLIRHRCATLLEASLHEWSASGVRRKVPVLVDQWLAAGGAAVHTLLTDPGDWTPDDLGGYVGPMVYRAFRQA